MVSAGPSLRLRGAGPGLWPSGRCPLGWGRAWAGATVLRLTGRLPPALQRGGLRTPSGEAGGAEGRRGLLRAPGEAGGGGDRRTRRRGALTGTLCGQPFLHLRGLALCDLERSVRSSQTSVPCC